MSSRFRFGINYKMGITFCKNKKQDEEVGGEELLKEIKEIKKQIIGHRFKSLPSQYMKKRLSDTNPTPPPAPKHQEQIQLIPIEDLKYFKLI